MVSFFEKGDTKIYHAAKPLVVYKRRPELLAPFFLSFLSFGLQISSDSANRKIGDRSKCADDQLPIR